MDRSLFPAATNGTRGFSRRYIILTDALSPVALIDLTSSVGAEGGDEEVEVVEEDKEEKEQEETRRRRGKIRCRSLEQNKMVEQKRLENANCAGGEERADEGEGGKEGEGERNKFERRIG